MNIAILATILFLFFIGCLSILLDIALSGKVSNDYATVVFPEEKKNANE
jgi:hypothetical protein